MVGALTKYFIKIVRIMPMSASNISKTVLNNPTHATGKAR